MSTFTSADPKSLTAAMLVVPVCEDAQIHAHRTFDALAKKARDLAGFAGKKNECVTVHGPARMAAGALLCVGLGKRAEVTPEHIRAAFGKAVRDAITKKVHHLVFAVPSARRVRIAEADLVSAAMEGAWLGNHVFGRYKSEEDRMPVEAIDFWVTAEAAERCADLPGRVATVCDAVKLAREWVSTPSNDKTPVKLAERLVSEAGKRHLKTTLFDDTDLIKENFGALMAAAAGSANPPRLVVMEYAPEAAAATTIALVGKGITFDTGGISLKQSAGMDEMKADMSGAAAVAGAMMAVAALKPGVRVIGVAPLVENMPSGSATRPGDIVTSFSGKTVEIGNTDAEGRLILADAMAYAIKTFAPDVLIDLATLTGACVVALGEKLAAVFSPDDALCEEILDAAASTHERCWRMPMPEDDREQLKSEFAEISNMGSTRWGGAITAALFLSEFVKDTRWAHIDIAGPAWQKKASDYCGAGGTGFGVRLLCDLIQRF